MAMPHFQPCFYIMPIRPRPRPRSVILSEDEYEDEHEDDITETDNLFDDLTNSVRTT